MRKFNRVAQVAFIAGMLGAGASVGAYAADPAPAAGAAVSVDNSEPSKLIETAATALLTGIDKNRAQFKKDPSGLYKLVGDTILPNFDTDFAAEKVLGQYWAKATPDQRSRFVKGFYHSLLYRYGDAMVDFSGDRFKVIPTKVTPDATSATVRTKIKRDNGTVIDVFFYMRKVNGGWKAYNMAFEGVNYIVTYRQEYGAEVQQKGLDAVIARLEADANAAKGKTGST